MRGVLKGATKYSGDLNSAHFDSSPASFLRNSQLLKSINPIAIPAHASLLAAPASSWRAFLKEICKFSLDSLIFTPAGVSFPRKAQLFN